MSTYTLRIVSNISNPTFDRIYNANSSTIDSNLGYSDKERLRQTFQFLGRTKFLIEIQKDGLEVVAYAKFGLSINHKHAFIMNIINDSDQSFLGLNQPIHNYLKSNGVEYLVTECLEGSSMYSSVLNNLNNSDLWQYDSSKDIIKEENASILSWLKIL